MTAIISFHRQDMILAEPEYVLAPDVILLPVQDGTLRIFDLSGHFFAVPAVGAQMLRTVLEKGVVAAVHQIATQYRVNPHQVRTDVETFMQDLQKQRLVYHRYTRRSQPQIETVLPYLLFFPVLCFVKRCLGNTQAAAWMLLVLARLSFSLCGWTQTLRVWQRCFQPTGKLIATDTCQDTIGAVDEVIRYAAAKHIFKVECKERALSCWALARTAGVSVKLIIGVRLFPLQGHCWCVFDAHVFGDDQDRCKDYMPVVTYV